MTARQVSKYESFAVQRAREQRLATMAEAQRQADARNAARDTEEAAR